LTVFKCNLTTYIFFYPQAYNSIWLEYTLDKRKVSSSNLLKLTLYFIKIQKKNNMYLTLIFLPLISSIISGLFGRFLGSQGSKIITINCILFAFLFSLFLFYEVVLMSCVTYIKLSIWINSQLFNVDWGFLFDSLTVIMCCIVTFISFLVHVYSTEYMLHDPHITRFMSYLSLFTFFMLILITADNFVQLFVGWEGVGLCSFLLINFWFARIQANKAAIKAMVINRIGDFGLALGIFLIFIHFKSVDYATVFALTPFYVNTQFQLLSFDFNVLNMVGILLFIGAIGKSAQLGLHTWLPDAMEGPTPVSALIHAATMVTAGVFLIARSSLIYEYIPEVLNVITFIGASTAFFAASVGLVQNDIKRIIAYSTCSQLGYMVFTCGLSNYSVGVFHLINHAFFKALLFLGAGSIIHAVSDEQDLRKMGGLKNLLPFTYSVIIIGSLALSGFPFLTGFYSKDVILETAYSKFTLLSHYSYYLGTLGAFLTAFYSTRLIYFVFIAKPNGYVSIYKNAKDSGIPIVFSLFLLTFPSIFFGYFAKDMFIGLGTDFWGNSLYVTTSNFNIIDSEFIDLQYKLLPLMFSFLGIGLACFLYTLNKKFLYLIKITKMGKFLYNFINKKWFFDKIYNEFIAQNTFKIGFNVSYKLIDKGLIEVFGPKGISNFISQNSIQLFTFQTKNIYHYSFSILFGMTFIFMLKYVIIGLSFEIIVIFFISIYYYYFKFNV
jgi:NADH-ubiquinone oxidoreductase chain 5|tara:strand:- start:19183 stop:21342 length:2160 start_codon:yes stop_codon:yes gene_type:complete